MTFHFLPNGLAVKIQYAYMSMFTVAQVAKRLRASIIVLVAIAASASHGATQTTPTQQADEDYQKVIAAAYHELANSSRFKISTPDLTTLIDEINDADKNNNSDRIAGLAASNMDIIQKNINAKEIAELSQIILKHHAVNLAQEILEYSKKNGDRHTQAKQQLEFAKYYANQNQWDNAIAYLKTFDLTNDVATEDSDEAYIIVGAALQAKKKHREALEYYKKIKPTSAHYTIAQLNMALVYIRQDWWTDAQITLEDAIKAAPKDDIEIVNRLYTTMGFSQLQQGFYRNARDSFRHVKINSAYSNRALLGIGMSALNQEDYAGAINAFGKLKTQDGNDMSVAQAYLLEAFTLTKTKQNEIATTKYNEAISYYGNKTNHYNDLLKTIKENNSATPLNTILDDSFFKDHADIKTLAEKLNNLTKLQGYPLSPNTQQQSANVYARISKAYIDLVADAVTKKQFVFNSYLNQSNFGLTRLYDNQ